MRSFISLLFSMVLLISCKSDTKKETSVTSSEVKEASLETLDNPVTGNSSLPRLYSNGKNLFMSWIEKDSLAVLKYSVLENGTWRDPEDILSGKDWFVNWADFPALAENNGNILTSFLQKSANGKYTYDVKLNLYNSEKNQWKKNFILNDDGTQSEHGFVSMMPYVANSFVVTWLDGRETVGKKHGGGAMNLRAAIVFEDGTIDHDTLLDEKVCDCCQTGTAIGPNDQIIVAYRDRSEDEIRDISVVIWQHDTGWTKPKTIGNDNWKIDGCPVNGPSVAANGNTIAVAWFTAAEEISKTNIAFSEDNGVTFKPPVRMDNGDAIGRVDVAMLSETEAAVTWMEPDGEDTLIQLQKVSSDGTKGELVTVAKTSAERNSGFPQLEIAGDMAYLAWTSTSENEAKVKTIKTASIKVADL